MRIGVPREHLSGERRVTLVPDVIRKLAGQGHEVVLEAGAGEATGLPDALFTMASGFAGIDNPLYYDAKTAMLFGDAKASVGEVLSEIQEL